MGNQGLQVGNVRLQVAYTACNSSLIYISWCEVFNYVLISPPPLLLRKKYGLWNTRSIFPYITLKNASLLTEKTGLQNLR